MIKLGPREKLYYPPGYFTNNPAAAPAPPEAEVVEEARARPTPTPQPTPRPTPEPSPTPDASATPEVAVNKDQTDPAAKGEAVASATPSTGADAQAGGALKSDEEMDRLAQQTKTKRFPRINAKPFKDLLAKSKAMLDAGELDLSGNINMTVEADRNEDGTLSNIRVTHVSTDNPKLKALAIEFVQALGASRALAALEGTRRLRMTVESNPSRVGAVVTTQVDTPERAREMELGYGGMLALGRLTKGGKDEGEIYKNTRVSASGNEVRMTFGMSRAAVKGMLSKQVPSAPPASKT